MPLRDPITSLSTRLGDGRLDAFGAYVHLSDATPNRLKLMTASSRTSIDYRNGGEIPLAPLLALYRACRWSAADKPEQLAAGLRHSHSVVSAWDSAQLVGLGNALSDGHLVVYFSHLLVLPAYRRQGIGQEIMRIMSKTYADFHQQVLVADGSAVDFYRKCGFARAGNTVPLWIYAGHDHDCDGSGDATSSGRDLGGPACCR